MPPSSSSTAEGQPAFDFTAWVFSALRYVTHLRLMMVCFALGILAGIVYYICGQPIYYSRALIRVTVLALPLSSESGKADATNPAGLQSTAFAVRAFQHQLTSDLIQKRVAVRLGVASQGDSPESIRQFSFQKVEISFVDADNMEVAIYSPYPHVVREYAATLIDEYEKAQKEVRDEFRKTAIDSYLAEMDEYHAKIDEHLKRRQEFEDSKNLAQTYVQFNNLVQVPKDIEVSKERLRRMNEALDFLDSHKDMETVDKLSMLNLVRSEKPVEVGSVFREGQTGTIQNAPPRPAQQPEIVVTPGMVDSLEPWRELEKQQRQLQEEIRRKADTYQPGHVVMRNLNAELTAVQDKLKAELTVATQRFQVERAGVSEKLKSLEAKLPEYKEITARYDKEQQDYSLLEQGQLNWKKAHTDLAMTVAKLEFGADRDRIHLDFASMVSLRDANPVSPNKSKLVMIALGLGLALSMGAPTLLLFTDSSVNRLEQLESHTGLKGLGVVPLSEATVLEDIFRTPVLDSTVPSFLLENFRIIRNNLNLSASTPRGTQVIMVTSARPGEGKTSLAANLAWSFHTMGEKTLLVDCDLRRGRVAQVTHTTNVPGLSSLLTDRASASEVILETDCPGLDVIPRGPIVSGATELLCQHKFEDLVTQWRARYDRVILDTPPVLGLGETSGLQRVTDGVILVVRAHKTRTKDVSDAADMLHRAGASIFGLVLNAVDLSKMANHYNYYYYSPQYYQAMETPAVSA